MNINITAKNTELTDALKSYIEKKIGKLEKLCTKIISTNVVISVERYRHTVDVKINAAGEIIKAKEMSKDMYSSIDLVYDSIEKQLKKFKEKLQAKDKGSKEEIGTETPSYREPAIVHKEFIPKPLTVEEAIMKLDDNDSQFVVFNSSENGKVCVVYKKKSGNFGLIETR